jgi:signal transduction histidine kinase
MPEIFHSMLFLNYFNPEIQKDYNDQLNKRHKKQAIIFSILVMILNIINILIFFFSSIESDLFKMLKTASYLPTGINFITLSIAILSKNTMVLKSCTYINFFICGFTKYILRNYFANYTDTDVFIIALIYTIQNLFIILWYYTNTIDYLQGLVITIFKGIALYLAFGFFTPTDKHFRFSVTSLVYILNCFLAYIYVHERKKSFYYYKLMEGRGTYYQNILENMNSGFLCISEDKVKFINKALLTSLNIRSIKNESNDSSINNICTQENIGKLDIKLILEELLSGIELDGAAKGFHTSTEERSISIFQSITNYLREVSSSKFSVLGTNHLRISESISVYYEISARYYKSSYNNKENIEFIFNDVSNIKVTEEVNAEFKYKTMFLSKVAHEFKNPILCITELVDQVYEKIIEIKETTFNLIHKNNITELLNNIKSMSNYLIILIKDMDFFSLKNQNISDIKIVKDVVIISDLLCFIKDITNVLIKKFDKEGSIQFTIHEPKFLISRIYADELRLKQILINLLSNSVKYTMSGEIKLEIQQDKNKITFIVEDTGIGIPEAKKASLFQPFMPANKNYTNISAGLGLYIVKELLSLLHSSIHYEPNHPSGSKFYFSLNLLSSPIIMKRTSNRFLSFTSIRNSFLLNDSFTSKKTVEIDFQPKISLTQKIILNTEGSSSLVNSDEVSCESFSLAERKKELLKSQSVIIVVDDEIMTRKSTVRMITEYCKKKGKDHKIFEAGDGLECLGLYYQTFKQGLKVLFIISDQSMTFLNGADSAKILYELNREKGMVEIPFFILTAYEQFALDSGVRGIYTKPLMNKYLDEIFRNVTN